MNDVWEADTGYHDADGVGLTCLLALGDVEGDHDTHDHWDGERSRLVPARVPVITLAAGPRRTKRQRHHERAKQARRFRLK